MNGKKLILCIGFLAFASLAVAQPFTKADSLRGTLSPLRSCYDVLWYDLTVKVDPATQLISGSNVMRFNPVRQFSEMQIDFFEGMSLDKVEFEGKSVPYRRQFNAVFLTMPRTLNPGNVSELKFEFAGRPTRAKNAPWDGGFVWEKDNNGKPWVGVACEGLGASCWWPMKDHLSDEPDSIRITLVAPSALMGVANGQLRHTRDAGNGFTAWEWAVTYPINSYNVTVNVADYVNIHDHFTNASGTHDLDYYVLSYNKEKAEKQFKQVDEMMRCYEKFFGEYPFWNDGYALVETPYLGMEHQGAIAYGNEYMPGYAGYDPLDLGFDYIVIHESGHEWWGNSVSTDDHGELWIHESFCTYAEAVYVECKWNYEKAVEYLESQKDNILNMQPVVGPRDVNFNDFGSSDMYYKGAWMLHSLRGFVNDDNLWWATIKSFAESFKYKVTNTDEVIKWFNQKLGADYTAFFRQYLYQSARPTFEYTLKKKGKGTVMAYRWNAKEAGFNLPIDVLTGEKQGVRIHPTSVTQKITLPVVPDKVTIDQTKGYFKNVKLTK
jgi:aminopeptidase N